MIYWVIAIVIVTGFVPVVLAHKIKFYPFNYIKPYLWLLFLASFYEGLFSLILKVDPHYWLLTYSFAEFAVLAYYYNRILNKKYQNIIILLGAFYAIGGITAYLTVYDPLYFDKYFGCVTTIFVYIFTILWFKDLFLELNVKSLWQLPEFYFVSAFLLYFSGTFFLFLLAETIFKNKETHYIDYVIVNIGLSFVLRILTIIGIWKARKV